MAGQSVLSARIFYEEKSTVDLLAKTMLVNINCAIRVL